MKLRTIGMTVVAALALVAGRAEAQEAGWDTQAGVLFTIPNLFQNGTSQVISEYGAGATTGDRLANDLGLTVPFNSGRIGAQYNLDSTHGIRATLLLGRFSEGITETTSGTPSVKVESVPLITSAWEAELAAQYLIRLGQAAVAPYVGGGVELGYASAKRKGKAKDSVTPDYIEYDHKYSALDFGLKATLGLEWRVHKVIAVFAEYSADLTLASTLKRETKTKNYDGVNPAVTTKAKLEEKHYLNLSTGIGQGGQLGIVAFF